MKFSVQRLVMVVGILCAMFGYSVHAQVNVTTYHNDISRTGQNTQETILTPSNVNSSQFGKLFTVSVDGSVYTQPLYVANVYIGGGTHNVVYVATQHDSVYAIDADSGTVYAKVSLIPAGGSPVNSATDLNNCTDIVPEVGITGTPVIDPSSGTLYVVAKAKVNGTFVQYLHALDIGTLSEKFSGPVNIQASVAGSASDGSGGKVSFNPGTQLQRPALLLENGHVIIGWGSHCDRNPWHGWLMSYNATTLSQEAAFNVSPNTSAGGIWISGGGIASDSGGNLFMPTGNGTWNGTTDFGETILKLGPPAGGTFPVVDYFTPYNQAALNSQDVDVGAGGLVLLPTLASGKQLLAQVGKSGTLVVLDRNNLGKYCPNQTPACTNSDSQIVQEIPSANSGVWGSPAYWNNNFYTVGVNDRIRAFSYNANNDGRMSTSPTSTSSNTFAYSAPTPSISANGTADAILWALDGSAYGSTCSAGTNCQILYAYDATNLGTMFYNSNQAANNRDVPGGAIKFAVPTIANGKVYVGSQSAVSAFGELGSLPTANAPTLSPAPGAYSGAQAVTLADAIAGASIYYTTDGTTPTTSSSQYTAGKPLQIGWTTTIKAIAAANGYHNSGVTVGLYSMPLPPGTSAASLSASANLVGLASPGTPVTGGGIDRAGNAFDASLLGTSITWSGATFTWGTQGVNDAVSSATISLPAGNYSLLTLLATGANGNQVNQTFVVTYTDGTTTTFTQSISNWDAPQKYSGESQVLSMPDVITSTGAKSTLYGPFYLYGYSFALNGAKTVRSITLPNNRNVVVLAIDLSPATGSPPVAATPTFSPASGTYTGTQSVSLADTTSGAVIYYTTDGTTPSTASSQYAGTPLTISATTTVQAIAAASGYTQSAVASATYTITAQPVAATPTFSLASGTYTGTQSVSLADTTSGAVIYYTTNGTTPSTASSQYAGTPLTVSASETVQAIAVASGYTQSAVASATYTITSQPVAATPTFSLASGTYTGTQSVSLADTTSGAVIYYTTNGTTPSTASSQYAGTPLTISTTTTVQAIAVASGYTQSAVASATYTITSSTSAPVSVSLAAAANVVGLANPGTAVTGGGIDRAGNAFDASLLGTSITWSGATFTLGTQGVNDAVSSATISLPAGSYSVLTMLAVGANSNQVNQTFVVTYTDGTTTSITQSLSNWDVPQKYSGESQVLSMPDVVTSTGAKSTLYGPFYLYGYSFTLNGAKTVQSITLPNNRNVVVLAIDLSSSAGSSPVAATPTFSLASGTYTGTQSVSLADTTSGAVIYYTTNGTTPSTASSQYVAGTPLTVSASETVQAIAVASGYTQSAVASATYTITSQPVAATPTFSPASGTYTGTQSVSLADTTSGAVIYYTTDGTTPSTASPQYVAGTPLTISATTTVQAIAVASGYTQSAVASATYTITAQPVAATPTFSLASGTYTGTQSVSLADTTSGAVIYYTTNGTTPSTASSQYVAGTPLTVSASETVQAIAVASGYTQSAVASATYTITASPSGPVSVSLAAAANVVGLANPGTAVTGGGIDRAGYAFDASLLGTSITWAGLNFTFGTQGVNDAVSSAMVGLPAGNYSVLTMLAVGANGNQVNQTLVVTYTDGTTTTFTQSLSNWDVPQKYSGESQVLSMPDAVVGPTGAKSTQYGPFYLYGYSFALNSAKTVQSITLPNNRNVVVLAIDLS